MPPGAAAPAGAAVAVADMTLAGGVLEMVEKVAGCCLRLRVSASLSAALATNSPVVAAAVEARKPASEWEAT